MMGSALSTGGSLAIVLLLGAVSVSLAAAAFVLADRAQGPRSTTTASTLAIAALVACAIVGVATSLGVRQTRHTIEVASEAFEPVAREQARSQGYRQSLVPAAIGTAAGAMSLGLAIAAVLRVLAARSTASSEAREGELSEESTDSSFLLGALVLGGFALFGLAASTMPLLLPLPGRGLPEGDPAWGLVEAEHRLAQGDASTGCATLFAALSKGARVERARVANVEGMKRECVEQRLEWALGGADPAEAQPALEALLAPPIALDASLRARVEQARDALVASLAR